MLSAFPVMVAHCWCCAVNSVALSLYATIVNIGASHACTCISLKFCSTYPIFINCQPQHTENHTDAVPTPRNLSPRTRYRNKNNDQIYLQHFSQQFHKPSRRRTYRTVYGMNFQRPSPNRVMKISTKQLNISTSRFSTKSCWNLMWHRN